MSHPPATSSRKSPSIPGRVTIPSKALSGFPLLAPGGGTRANWWHQEPGLAVTGLQETPVEGAGVCESWQEASGLGLGVACRDPQGWMMEKFLLDDSAATGLPQGHSKEAEYSSTGQRSAIPA